MAGEGEGEKLEHMKRVQYHQRSSLMKVMIKWASTMTQEEQGKTVLNLVEVEHGFPYGLYLLSKHMTKLSMLIPNLTTITLVTDDKVVDLLALVSHLISMKLVGVRLPG